MNHDEECYRDAIKKMNLAAKKVLKCFKDAKFDGGWSVHHLQCLQGFCDETALWAKRAEQSHWVTVGMRDKNP